MKQIKVELQEWMGSDRSIAEAAWTSSLDYQLKKKRTEDDVIRVVKMLAENKHATPFESVIYKFWVKMPIQTDRQHLTHRIGSHSGLSGRYRTMPSEYLDVPDELCDLEDKIFNVVVGEEEAEDFHLDNYYRICEEANNFYKRLMLRLKDHEKDGVITNQEYKRAREFYRGMLPLNNMTERVSIFNLRSFANYQKLRNSPHAQPEIQQVAKLMLEEVKKVNNAPIAIEWLEKNNWNI